MFVQIQLVKHIYVNLVGGYLNNVTKLALWTCISTAGLLCMRNLHLGARLMIRFMKELFLHICLIVTPPIVQRLSTAVRLHYSLFKFSYFFLSHMPTVCGTLWSFRFLATVLNKRGKRRLENGRFLCQK